MDGWLWYNIINSYNVKYYLNLFIRVKISQKEFNQVYHKMCMPCWSQKIMSEEATITTNPKTVGVVEHNGYWLKVMDCESHNL